MPNDTGIASKHKMALRNSGSTAWRWLLIIAVVTGSLILLWKLLPVEDYLRASIGWIDEQGSAAVVAFYFVYVAAALTGIPRTILNIAAGVLFSYPVALATVLVAAATAYLSTFYLARTFLSDWVRQRVGSSESVQRVLKLVEEEGFKLVFLMRVNPFIPGVVKGYGLGTTDIRFATYFPASLLGFLPIALVHVYVGWAGGAAMLYDAGESSPLHQWLLYGGIAASLILVAIVYFSYRAMNRRYEAAAE